MTPKRQQADLVPRPLKRAEYEIVFVTRSAEKGWRDFLATSRNAVVDAWDHLCRHPADEDGKRVYQLRADYAVGTYEGTSYNRYQYKMPNGARIWYFIQARPNEKAKTPGRVLIEQVYTAHPNETK